MFNLNFRRFLIYNCRFRFIGRSLLKIVYSLRLFFLKSYCFDLLFIELLEQLATIHLHSFHFLFWNIRINEVILSF
jgi:hypothetical protein